MKAILSSKHCTNLLAQQYRMQSMLIVISFLMIISISKTMMKDRKRGFKHMSSYENEVYKKN